MNKYTYYVYITTNPSKSVLYIGVTNNLNKRINQHYLFRGKSDSYTGRYHCYNLVYYEAYNDINEALAREKQLKKWSRKKKEELIETINPQWDFLNDITG